MTTPIPPTIQPFWNAYQSTISHDASPLFYESFHFDDNEPTANSLAALVLSGQKRATAGLLWTNEITNKPLPGVGALSVVTDWSGVPRCIIETTHVEIVPFDEVTADFAAIEGEGDSSLRYWKEEHWKYFTRECARLGREPDARMPVVCEQFRVVYPTMDRESVHEPRARARSGEEVMLDDFGKRYAMAWCSQNPGSVAEFFVENGSLSVNDGAPAVGRAAIAEVAPMAEKQPKVTKAASKKVEPLSPELRELEESLLQSDARKSNRLVELLDDSFVEYGSSGRIYTKADLVATLQAEPTVHTLRSSVWKRKAGQWRMVFHQATATTAP